MDTVTENNDEVSPVEGWTNEEKFYLLQCLKTFGSHDMEQLKENIPTKTSDEILAAIQFYKQKASKHPIFEKKQVEKVKDTKPRVPLASWAKLLTDSLSYADLCTETATALRMIADLEHIPIAGCTENINIRTIYHEIANAMEGKPLIKDKTIAAIINKCLVETALSSKAYIPNSAVKYLVNSVNLADKEMNVFPRPTSNHELGILRHLASQRNYNPLNISENYLKPSFDLDPNDDDDDIMR